MKQILIGTVAVALLAGSAASAQPYRAPQHDNHAQDQRLHPRAPARAHRWARGQRLPSQYRTRRYYVDYRSHHLRKPPRGYQWVRADNDYALVALTSGLIAELIASSR
jgi:Ni/Co efflux regulator RcnB